MDDSKRDNIRNSIEASIGSGSDNGGNSGKVKTTDQYLQTLMESSESATGEEMVVVIENDGLIFDRRHKGDQVHSVKNVVKKENFLINLLECRGIIAEACRRTGVSYTWYRNHLRDDLHFAQAVNDVQEMAVDYVEGKLLENIAKGYEASIFYFLNNRARHRGYAMPTVVRGGGKNSDLEGKTDEELIQELKRLEHSDGLIGDEETGSTKDTNE